MSDTKERFVLTFPIKTELWEEHILEKRFRIGERIYNQFLEFEINKYREMTKTRKYRKAVEDIVSLSNQIRSTKDKAELKTLKAKRKDANQVIYDIKKDFNWSKFGFSGDMKQFRGHYKKNLSSQICNSLATRCFSAFENVESENWTSLLKGEEPKSFVHFKRANTLRTLSGQQNTNGIRCIDTDDEYRKKILWQGLTFYIHLNKKSTYDWQAFRNDIAYCSIKRNKIKGKWHYYVQIVFKGHVPTVYDKETGEAKRQLGKGHVGLYFQATKLTVANENTSKVYNLALKGDGEDRLKELQTLMNNSRRAMNPDNYNDDGTNKEGKLKWVVSNRYKKYRNELNEIYRKQDAEKKIMREMIANEVISMGDSFSCNDMSFKFLQSKIGAAIQTAGPAMLKTTIERKLKYHEVEINSISYSVLNEQMKKENITKSENEKVAQMIFAIS